MAEDRRGRTKPLSKNVDIPQGPRVLAWGTFGSLLAIAPAAMLVPGFLALVPPWSVLVPVSWACFVGSMVTHQWSMALHNRVGALRDQLHSDGALIPEEKRGAPDRLPWMAAWIGIFERAFYCFLIAQDATGAAAFIAVWIGLKSAGGWQMWSKGTTYGRATFSAGLLGNAMSVLFGVIAGLAIRFQATTALP